MTHFPTIIRLLTVDTLAEIVVLHDPANGIELGDEIVEPAPAKRQSRRKYARVGGSFPTGARVPDDGTLIVPISIKGSTWAQKETRYLALYAAIDSEEEFYVEVELSGVRKRWYCDAPVDVLPEPITAGSRINSAQDYELRFLVQPSPSVTIV